MKNIIASSGLYYCSINQEYRPFYDARKFARVSIFEHDSHPFSKSFYGKKLFLPCVTSNRVCHEMDVSALDVKLASCHP